MAMGLGGSPSRGSVSSLPETSKQIGYSSVAEHTDSRRVADVVNGTVIVSIPGSRLDSAKQERLIGSDAQRGTDEGAIIPLSRLCALGHL